MTDDDIKAARALCEAATPGAWAFMDEAYPWVAGAVDEDIAGPSTVVEFNECGEQAHADARFIAAARTLVPVLLDALESMRLHAANITTDLHKAQGHARMWSRHNDEARERADKAERDLAATKAALVEAMELAEDGWRHAHFSDKPKGAARLAALKAKVRP